MMLRIIIYHFINSNTDSYSFLTAASQLPANDNDIQQLLDKVVKSEAYKYTYFIYSTNRLLNILFFDIIGIVVSLTKNWLLGSLAS